MNNKPLNNPIWVMSSAFDQLNLDQLIEKTIEVGAQGIDLCVFRKDGTREDHTATHLDYENFGPNDAEALIDRFNHHQLGLSLGAFENMIGGEVDQRVKNQNHRSEERRVGKECRYKWMVDPLEKKKVNKCCI